MKRIGFLFEQVSAFSNLLFASQKALKASGGSPEGQAFLYNLENELLNLKREMQNGSYKPGPYRYFNISDPKDRIISVAPFRDRVVHHALVNVLEPIYAKVFIFDSYATRKNKGTHKAIFRAQQFLRKNKWFLKTDVQKYFDSIDRSVLKQILQRKIKDKRLLNILHLIIDNGGQGNTGLPIGNLTSQFFANVYLDQLDHYLKDQQGLKYYIRYMDDMVVFSESKEKLKAVKKEISLFLNERLNLKLKESATFINQQLNGLSFLGRRIFPGLIRLKKENLKRSMKKLQLREKQYLAGKIEQSEFINSAQSILAHISSANHVRLREKLFGQGSYLKAAPTG